MFARLRFWIYRHIVGLFTWVSFRTQRVEPLQPPTETRVGFRPHAASFPDMPIEGLFDTTSFPASDAPRLRRMRLAKKLLSLVRRIAPPAAPPVPDDERRYLAALYPASFRRAWPLAPQVPAELKKNRAGPDPDLIAELAVGGPFACFLRRATDDEVRGGQAAADSYVIDLSWMLGHPAFPNLVRPGGKAVLKVQDGRLRTVGLHRQDKWVPAAELRGRRQESEALLAAMNEDVTVFRHCLSVHLATLTPFALATTNCLGLDHPVRRVLHHCFHTVLVGNHEVAEFQLSGPQGFAATIFSHDSRTIARMAAEHLGRYDFWEFEPETWFARQATAETPFAYPYRDNVLELWAATRAYLEAYVRLYYDGDAALRADTELKAWMIELNRLVPNGIRIPEGGPTRDWLSRVCATLIQVSIVEHDYVANVAWNYSTLGWIVPTAVPLSGERMDQRRAFDLIATMIVTWKPYNMLLTADVPALALDEAGRRVMTRWIADLGRIQREMEARGQRLSLSYPANLNVSVSN